MGLEGKKINLFIVGAAKCGTTSLYSYLDVLDDVFMCPVKEPHFFSNVVSETNKIKIDIKKKYHSVKVKDFKEYLSIFDDVKEEKIIGEASTSYLWDENAAQRIFEYNPDAKIIIMIRNPIERAYSHYQMQRFTGAENLSFIDSIKKDIATTDKVWGRDNIYLELGFYKNKIERFQKIFPYENVYVVSFKNFKLNTKEEFIKICDFLQIDYNKEVDFKIYNKTIKFKNRYLSYFKRKINFLKFPSFLKKFIKKATTATAVNNITSDEIAFLTNIYSSELNYLNSKHLI